MRIERIPLEKIITGNMGEYSTYVLLQRAIPDVRDGLKPSYRRSLWAMKEMGATKLTKSANIAGETMRYHPHGSTYPTMVGMAQKDAQHNPYIIGKGNFGSYASELAYASDRYTEMKLSEMSLDMMADTNKNGIDFIDNYDSTRKMPEVFPVKYPSILAYAQSGIGVGFSSSIPSFNLVELNNAVAKYIETGEKTYLVPDFGTKGYVIEDKSIIKLMNEEGRGSIKLRAKAEIDGLEIIITEVPYSTTKEKIIKRIKDLVKQDKLREVRDIEDGSGLSGLQIIVTAKRGTDMELLLEKLYQDTPMESSYSANMMVLNTDGLPKLMGVWGIVDEWLEWRRGVIHRMLEHDTKIKKRNLEILYGLDIIKDDLEEVVEIIRKSTDENIIKNLMKEFGLSKMQAERIAELKLRNLTTTFIKKQIDTIGKLEKAVANNEKAMKSDEIKNKMIIKDLEDVNNKFGKERQSEIITKSEVEENRVEIPVEDEFGDYNVRVFITEENYIKKIPLTSLRGATDIKTKHSDKIIHEVETTNVEEVLIFTDKNNVFKKRLYELPDHKPSDLGTYVPSIIDLAKDEQILYITALNSEHSFMLIAFEDGRIAKIDIDAYRTKTNRSVLRGAFADKTPLLFKVLSEDIDLMAIAEDEKTVLLNTEIISSKATRGTQGNIFIRLRDDVKVKEYRVNPDFENVEYYRLKSAGTGKYWKE